MDSEGARLLVTAARLLDGDSMSGMGKTGQAEAMLHVLGYPSLVETEKAQASQLLRVGSYISDIFEIPSKDAPGLTLMGGKVDPASLGLAGRDLPKASLTGSGRRLREALEACLGEGIEYLSQIERDGDVVSEGNEACAAARPPERDTELFLNRLDRSTDRPAGGIDWIEGALLETGEPCMLPADLVLRRAPGKNRFPSRRVPSSVGCAAGQTTDHAILGGMLELIERHAVAHWWTGGERARPVHPSVLERAGIAQIIQDVRLGSSDRRTWFLDITTDVDIPVIAALSLQRAGRGFALGLGAHPDPAVAVWKAFNELCQGETAYEVVDAKEAQHGSSALNAVDLNHQKRRHWDGAEEDPILKPQGEYRLHSSGSTDRSVSGFLSEIRAELTRHSVSVYVANLTRPEFNVPAVWVGTANLIPFPCEPAVGTPTATADVPPDRLCEYEFTLM